ncbi:MAG: alpha amylase C-terminal domain-containing protein [Bacteroidaceae bacterium]|nr:alpha amylase C-terminal domain-containing protein [Bacteroidaceae bacterium]
MVNLVKNDKWLTPFKEAIEGRHQHAVNKAEELSGNGTLRDFASGYLYFGLHKTDSGWVFREWAPNATEIFLVGDFSDWLEDDRFRLKRIDDNGVWELTAPSDSMHVGQNYKMRVFWQGGKGDRIPAWSTYVVQDPVTKIFTAKIADDAPYKFKVNDFKLQRSPLMIYETHVGMAQEYEGVGSYREFEERILPRVKKLGYNCIQIMAIQEHPYYGSFGYHVSSFFAPSSRFGCPNDLKHLIDTAHGMGIGVIMDIVHSHAVKNTEEGLGLLCGDPYQYFMRGSRREHSAWGSLCFDYGKNQVIHFLLSNCRYWLEEFKFDGFRFDGVTSMLYYSHGLNECFTCYGDYFNGHQDDNAICYLTLANMLVHQVNPNAVTIAEEVSGMPGLAAPVDDGGYGFDYRMAMNIPDYWIKTIKERKDEDWKPSSIFWELTNRRQDEKTISYAESHDQALVGDKTISFRLMDSDMYWHFKKDSVNYTVERGISLHKMIRLVSASTINGGYLNFMGNEFGHPEWIDFPRLENGWSHKYARRQWSLVDNSDLCYHWLSDFDAAMIKEISGLRGFVDTPVVEICKNDGDQILAYMRGKLLFVFNFNPVKSFADYGIVVPEGSYSVALDSDAAEFGGQARNDTSVVHYTDSYGLPKDAKKGRLYLYIPARTAVILKKRD